MMSIIGFYVEDYYSNPISSNTDAESFIAEISRLALLTVALTHDIMQHPNRAEMYMWN